MTSFADTPAPGAGPLIARLIRGVLALGAVVNFLLTGVGTGISFLVKMLLARKMGPHEFGLYAYAMGWTSLALLPAKLDLDNAATRFAGAHAGNDEWDLVRGFVRRGTQMVLLSSAIVAVLGAFAMAAWNAYRGQVTSQVFLAAAIFLPATALMLYLANVLQGSGWSPLRRRRSKWIYTAATRAKKQLIVLSKHYDDEGRFASNIAYTRRAA